MTARLYKSTDASAPALTGQVGSLVAVLDAVLVNGYGTMTAAGWTKPYNATNKGVYRNSTTNGTGFYLDVDDSAPATAKEARVRGYEVMTAVATGTGPFPTTAQMTNGLFARKSVTADSVARPWFILADDTVFYMFVETGDQVSPTRTYTWSFGDFYSYKANDAYRCQIMARTGENTGGYNLEALPLLAYSGGVAMSATCGGNYLARSYTGVGGSVNFGKHADTAKTGVNNTYAGILGQSYGGIAMSYPNPAEGGLYVSPIFVHHERGVRGYLKGLWAPLQDMPLGHGDTFNGTGSLSAKSFLCMWLTAYANGQSNGECFLETTNTWS